MCQYMESNWYSPWLIVNVIWAFVVFSCINIYNTGPVASSYPTIKWE